MRIALIFAAGAIFGAMLALFIQASQPHPQSDDDNAEIIEVELT